MILINRSGNNSNMGIWKWGEKSYLPFLGHLLILDIASCSLRKMEEGVGRVARNLNCHPFNKCTLTIQKQIRVCTKYWDASCFIGLFIGLFNRGNAKYTEQRRDTCPADGRAELKIGRLPKERVLKFRNDLIKKMEKFIPCSGHYVLSYTFDCAESLENFKYFSVAPAWTE